MGRRGHNRLSPDIKFDKHKAGIQANAYVQRYGMHQVPDLYEAYNPMTYKSAVDMEIELGISLRGADYGSGRRSYRAPKPTKSDLCIYRKAGAARPSAKGLCHFNATVRSVRVLGLGSHVRDGQFRLSDAR